jgi:hypothetical protein
MFLRTATTAAIVSAAVLIVGSDLAARDVALPMRLTGHAVNLGTPGRTGSLVRSTS